MSVSVAKSFQATGVSNAFALAIGRILSYVVTGTFTGTWVIDKSVDGGLTWQQVVTGTAQAFKRRAILTRVPTAARLLCRKCISLSTSLL